MSLSSDVLMATGGAERMLAGCESMQRGDEEGVIEMANDFEPEGNRGKFLGVERRAIGLWR
ncbi:MAG: hypothetical protein N2V76_09010 [Methanophagales archaeon]|nr:hypothetical protein [Methanophagales archaeon]